MVYSQQLDMDDQRAQQLVVDMALVHDDQLVQDRAGQQGRYEKLLLHGHDQNRQVIIHVIQNHHAQNRMRAHHQIHIQIQKFLFYLFSFSRLWLLNRHTRQVLEKRGDIPEIKKLVYKLINQTYNLMKTYLKF